jgi:hypothetical protein
MGMEHWFVRWSRFGTTHLVRAQEGRKACGVACSMMAACRMNKWKTVQEGMLSEADTYKKIQKVTPLKTYDGTGSIERDDMATLLNSLGMGIWTASLVDPTAVADDIASDASVFQLCTVPIITGITWNRRGGHWVMIDQVFNVFGTNYAIVNDPWDANIHVMALTPGTKMTYNASRPTFAFEVWGKEFADGSSLDDRYATASVGYFDGHIVRCTGMSTMQRVQHAILA